MIDEPAPMPDFVRDPNDWLRKLAPDEWLRAALGELRRAEDAMKRHDARAAIAGCKRAAGMALNAALIVEERPDWGRTYVEHLTALANDASAPEAVRRASKTVKDAQAPGPAPRANVIALRTPKSDEIVLEAARDVVAHAYAVVKRHEPT